MRGARSGGGRAGLVPGHWCWAVPPWLHWPQYTGTPDTLQQTCLARGDTATASVIVTQGINHIKYKLSYVCVTIYCGDCIHQWMRTRYRYMWRLYHALHCTVPWAGTRHCCSCYQSITQSRAGTTNLQPVFAPPPHRLLHLPPHICLLSARLEIFQ